MVDKASGLETALGCDRLTLLVDAVMMSSVVHLEVVLSAPLCFVRSFNFLVRIMGVVDVSGMSPKDHVQGFRLGTYLADFSSADSRRVPLPAVQSSGSCCRTARCFFYGQSTHRQ